MLPKARSLKRATSTQEEYKIQLELEIENNNNIIDVRDQIRALATNQKADCLKVKNI